MSEEDNIAGIIETVIDRLSIKHLLRVRRLERDDVRQQAALNYLIAVAEGRFVPEPPSLNPVRSHAIRIEAYLCGLITRTIYDMGKSRRRRTEREHSHEFIQEIAIDRRMAQEEPDTTSLERQVQDLASTDETPVSRTLLALRLEGLSMEEIANRLGISTTNARQKFHRLKMRLVRRYRKAESFLQSSEQVHA